jgi:hypothetical protein
MEVPHTGPSVIEGQGVERRGGARVVSLAQGVAGQLDLVDVILIVGAPLVAFVVHGFSDLMNNYVEPERALLRSRSTR